MDWTRGHSIGHGSTATVSLATSIQSGDVFAVKSVEFFQSGFLQREQRILSSLTSPFIVSYRGCDITRENSKVMYNLFLEYMPDGTLSNAIHSHGGRLDESLIRNYTSQVLQGLDYIHLNGLVHCDIKSSNILVGPSGAKIADFGCAKRVEQVGQIAGTPMFMAPEVARGEEQGFASDIWALGCAIIEMASGSTPWHNVNDPVSIIYRVGYSGHLPDFPSCLSEQARDLLDKCLRRDPRERWTASQLLKHPFLVGESNSLHVAKQIQESNSSSNSPTSILDQCFWNSLDLSESLNNSASVPPRRESSAGERVRGLSLLSGMPRWDWDESWTTIRGDSKEERDAIMDCIEVKDDIVSCGLGEQKSYGGSRELLNFLDSNISSRSFDDFWVSCKYRKVRFGNPCMSRLPLQA
ncbi:mitogen-activated protein kinase kinase kinase 18-like [Populus alba x Populus x berolinensis]|uniref:mitogen-activated protein kinase kinase kinase n=1 Tax=Populus alba x Populus x berolinensis TaxID=444605 RepID=A0AAD6RHM2_9ROSI|nr:mitogen-activated protein kinase kinase kinase 18-like [Populus alba x Populus x berolinensis]